MFILEIDLALSRFSRSLSQISDNETSIEAHQEGEGAQDPSEKIMAPWTFHVKFPYNTQFTFESLTFAAGEDGNIKMLPSGSTPKRLTPVYGQAPYFPAISCTTGGTCSGLDPYVGLCIHTVMLVRGILIMTSILQPLTGASSSSSSEASPDQDSADDYPEIGGSTCEDPTEEGCLIIMVAPTRGPLQNSSSRYPTNGRSETFNARTTNDGMIQNLNSDFNPIQLQTIMESIHRMAPEGSPLVALAQQGAEVTNFVIAQRLAGNPRGEPSVSNRSNDRVKRARSETTSSASGNHRLANNDVRWWITQNYH
jgi:hypothetical protein